MLLGSFVRSTEICTRSTDEVDTVDGHLLEKYNRARVTAIARSTFNAINEKGITIRSEKWSTVEHWKPTRGECGFFVWQRCSSFPVARSIEEVLDIPFDYVIVTTKAVPEISTTAHLLKPLFDGRYQHPQPTYVLLQNGLNVEKDLHTELIKRFEQPLIISCALYIMTNITANGDVMHGSFASGILSKRVRE